jgi:hypothetical protein
LKRKVVIVGVHEDYNYHEWMEESVTVNIKAGKGDVQEGRGKKS